MRGITPLLTAHPALRAYLPLFATLGELWLRVSSGLFRRDTRVFRRDTRVLRAEHACVPA
jgi:hypothetical protein